jgi:hypothetical protein
MHRACYGERSSADGTRAPLRLTAVAMCAFVDSVEAHNELARADHDLADAQTVPPEAESSTTTALLAPKATVDGAATATTTPGTWPCPRVVCSSSLVRSPSLRRLERVAVVAEVAIADRHAPEQHD